jgi:1,4-dihydroxy-2-naphthoyl-CoA synthase
MSIKYVLDSSVSSVPKTGGNGSSSQIKQVGYKEIRETYFFMNVYGHVQLGRGARTIPSSGKVSLIHNIY